MSALNVLVNLFRGALIGVTEIIPGVSGGTIALLIGVYETLIDSAGHLVCGVVRAAVDTVRGRGLNRAREHFSQVKWGLVLPIGIGMLVALVIAARLLAPLIEAHPIPSRALFAGLIAVSLIVPARMLGARWQLRDYAIAVPAAVLSFVLTGLPSANDADPSPIAIFVSAAVAVCALVLPGVSGSFVLVTTGMYEPTLRALNSLDLGYIALFAVGAVTGLALFVQVLLWLLSKHRRVTLALMTGLMAGSLRALWGRGRPTTANCSGPRGTSSAPCSGSCSARRSSPRSSSPKGFSSAAPSARRRTPIHTSNPGDTPQARRMSVVLASMSPASTRQQGSAR